MEINIQIQRAADALDQLDGTGLRRVVRKSCLLGQMCNCTVDVAEHLAHDLRGVQLQSVPLPHTLGYNTEKI